MIKLGRLKLYNFKSFSQEFFDFRNFDAVIFDGPNGYGKTSIFDAIEFCITKNISRIREIDNKVKSNPLLRLNKEFNGVLTLELSENDLTKIIIELVIPVKDIKSHNDNIAHEIYFYEKWEDIGESGKRVEVESLQDFLNIDNLESLFTIFNYIQQEDSLHFLKFNETQRHKQIDFLFGIEKQKNELNKIKEFEKLLNDKCFEVYKESDDLKNKIESFKKDIEFFQDGTCKSLFFDEAENISDENLHIINSDFKKILEFISISTDYLEFKKNEFIKLNLKENNYNKILNLINFENYFELEKNIKRLKWLLVVAETNNLYSSIYTSLNSGLSDFLKSILICNDEKIYLIVNKNKEVIDRYLSLLNGNNSLNATIEEINFQRMKLISDYKSHFHADNGVCPLCGTDFLKSKDLDDSMNKMSDTLKSVSLSNEKDIDEYRNIIYDKVVKKIQLIIEIHFKRFNILSGYLDLYKKFDLSHSEFLEIKSLTLKLQSLGLDFKEKEKIDVFFERNSINKDLILSASASQEFDYIFNKYKIKVNGEGFIYKNNLLLDEKIISNELFFVEAQFRKNSLLSLNENNNKYQSISIYSKHLNEKKKMVKELRVKYEKEIQYYESELVNNIQIPFYVYSSKILQTRGADSGIYLRVSKTRQHKNYIKFSASKNDDNDAWNKMSSGQLAGLVISLMLTMNKVFPTNLKTLLIDDPVQTMDDINMASLVQLLLHEFSDYQFLLSTHEPRVASFFKRKFSSFDNHVKTINLKNDRSAL